MTDPPTPGAPSAAPARVPQSAPNPIRQQPPVIGLGTVIATGLQALNDLRHLSRDVTSGELARALHSAVEHHYQRASIRTGADRLARVAVSVRIAGAHLDAGNLVDARLALEGARYALPYRDRQAADADAGDGGGDGGDGGQADEQARAASWARQRGLRAHAILAQAVGVLAEHTGAGPDRARTALRRHAERHRFVVSELAADVVAGRVAPSAIVEPSVDRGSSDDAATSSSGCGIGPTAGRCISRC